MALVNPMEMIKNAQRQGKAVAAFNIHNMETMQGVVAAAAQSNTSVILQGTPGTLRGCGVKTLVAMARAMAADCPVDLALHADHCSDYELLLECIDEGFTSVMIDGAALPYDQNVAFVRDITQKARKAGAAAEGELGRIGGVEDSVSVDDRDAFLTDPAQAADYVRQTGIDTLAVAIGTAHGEYKGNPELDFPRLAAIRAVVDIPLVLHGASGVPDEDVRRCVQNGVCKVNIATELKLPFTGALRKTLAEYPGESDPRKLFAPAREAVFKVATDKIRLCEMKC